jgi:hypothetical protein
MHGVTCQTTAIMSILTVKMNLHGLIQAHISRQPDRYSNQATNNRPQQALRVQRNNEQPLTASVKSSFKLTITTHDWRGSSTELLITTHGWRYKFTELPMTTHGWRKKLK